MTHITQDPVVVRGTHKTSGKIMIPLLDISHQFSHSECIYLSRSIGNANAPPSTGVVLEPVMRSS
jgi:hypothetical protein